MNSQSLTHHSAGKPQNETLSPTTSVPPAPNGQTILLVEDNAPIARALGALLSGGGYHTVTFTSALPAIKYAQSSTPDAAVVDVHLPDLSGLVVARAMRDAFGPSVPIIICSGDTSMETLNALRDVGATYFLPKPIQGSKLLERIKEWLPQTTR